VLAWIGAAVAVAGLVVGIVVGLGGHGERPRPVRRFPAASPTVTPTPAATRSTSAPAKAPAFDFRVLKFTPVRGSPRTRVKVVRERTRGAVRHIRDELGRMYRLAFLDPADWQHDRYGRAFRFFAGEARTAALRHATLLTLGPDAGRRFERVASARGTLKIRVLLDRGGHPFTAVATADFRARAVRTAGGATLVHSLGSYFLRPSRHGWLIFGFQVHRKDRSAT
jgi:hypothetical protein